MSFQNLTIIKQNSQLLKHYFSLMIKFQMCEDFQLLVYLYNFVSVKLGSNSTLKVFSCY